MEQQTKTTRELADLWWQTKREIERINFIQKYSTVDKFSFREMVEHIYLSENPQTETKVEDVQPTEEIERHARLIENADAMYSALQAVNTCMTLDTPLAIETHKRILELLHKIDNK